MNERVGVIVQARMGSSRLPGKVLLPLAGSTVMGVILDKFEALLCKGVVQGLVVATTVQPADDLIAEVCGSRGVEVFRGSEQDVLDRYRAAAEAYAFDVVVRATCDNPFVDTALLERTVDLFQRGRYDYAFANGAPIGVAAEVVRFSALSAAAREAVTPQDREHVTTYIKTHPDRFKLTWPTEVPDTSGWRLTVDTPEDYDRALRIVEHFGPGFKGLSYRTLVDFLTEDLRRQEK